MLHPNTEFLIDKEVLIETADGYGWEFCKNCDDFTMIETPACIVIKIEALYYWSDSIIGLGGRVITSGRFFDGFSMCALARAENALVLTIDSTPFNLLLSPSPPQLTGKTPPYSDSVRGIGYPQVRGYAAGITLK